MTTHGEFHEKRYEENVRYYEGHGIVVHWEPSLCIHMANCVGHLREVFVPNARPWVQVDAATADEIAETIRTCPTGALRYERTDGASQEQPDDPMTVQPRPNGPLFMRGDIRVVDAIGGELRRTPRAAFCRCGASENKPFCDNSHLRIGFLD
jgi:uncharacterized Fe-S cluster protein YjdI